MKPTLSKTNLRREIFVRPRESDALDGFNFANFYEICVAFVLLK